MTDFVLDERLEADTVFIQDLTLSRMLMMNDSRYPWIILVPRISDVREIHGLSEVDRNQLMSESCNVANFMMDHFHIEKMNVGALGNIVPQLHLHLIGRHSKDPAWPGPVWGHSAAEAFDEDALKQQIGIFQGFQ